VVVTGSGETTDDLVQDIVDVLMAQGKDLWIPMTDMPCA